METNEIQHFEAPSMNKTGQWFDFSVYPSAEEYLFIGEISLSVKSWKKIKIHLK